MARSGLVRLVLCHGRPAVRAGIASISIRAPVPLSGSYRGRSGLDGKKGQPRLTVISAEAGFPRKWDQRDWRALRDSAWDIQPPTVAHPAAGASGSGPRAARRDASASGITPADADFFPAQRPYLRARQHATVQKIKTHIIRPAPERNRLYEDEDNDGKFPDESPVEVRYPARSGGRAGRPRHLALAAWIHRGTIDRPAAGGRHRSAG